MKPSVGERIYSYARSGDVVGLQTMANDFPEHVNWRHPRNYKQTALWSASKYGRVAAVTFLLKHGADPLLCDESGMSCVEIACIEGKVMVLQELVASNARLALAPRALFFAAQEGRTGVVKILLQHGASPDVMCEGRFSPLMAAACGNHVAVMSLLVAHDVSLESATDEGDAALHLAAKSNKADACRCLLLHGASGSRTNKSGKVPLDIAEERKNSCVEILRNPPRLTGLPLWRPSLHRLYPLQFKHDAKGLVFAMTRLRCRDPANYGPLWMLPNDLVKQMVFFLAEAYRNNAN